MGLQVRLWMGIYMFEPKRPKTRFFEAEKAGNVVF